MYALIIAIEPQRQVTVRFGFGWLIGFEESYSLTPVPVGSRLVHSFRCTGIIASLKRKKMRRNFRQMLEITDRLFQRPLRPARRSEEHTSELQSLMSISYAVFCLKQK